jgi:Ca2+-binding EF-hand superfamily protein
MRNVSKLFAAGLFGALVGTAWADDVPSFEALDKDGDGYVSREEAAAAPGLVERFSTLDQDGDGRLSRAEYARAADPMNQRNEGAI